jgi:hypothetical protein
MMKKSIGKLVLILLVAVVLFPVTVSNGVVEAGTDPALVDNMKKKSRQFFDMKDENGVTYNVYIFSNNEKKKVTGRSDIWAGASEGDIWYTGDYHIALRKKGSNVVHIQRYDVVGYEYNYTRKMIYLLSSKNIGQPDIISFSTTECSNCREARMYYIKDGRIERVKIKTDDDVDETLWYSEKPKVIGKNLYQSVVFTNTEDIGVHFNTYSFNPKTGVMTLIKTKSYINDQQELGDAIYKKWKASPAYVVN